MSSSWVYSQIFLVWIVLCSTVCPCRSVTVAGFSGQNVTLPCQYNMKNHGNCDICWMRGDIPNSGCGNEILYSTGNKVSRQTSGRYQLHGDLQKGDVSLTISDATEKDSGRYGCRVHVPGLFNDEKIIVDLVIMKGPLPRTEVNSLLTSTSDPHSWHTEPTHANSTSHYSNTSTAEANKTVKEPTNETLPVTIISIMLIFLVSGLATYLIWKKKRRTWESSEVDQNSAIYNNVEVNLGLSSRSMAVENIYQLDTENEYEQWSR